MSDEDDIPQGLNREQWAGILVELNKREAANQKRSETMKAKAAAKKAERLALPPVDLDEAWRRHADTCPHPAYSQAATGWFRENKSFDFDGTAWRRERRFQTSNSGKSKRLRSITYHGADGRVVTSYDEGPNRRNDSDRDWGLPDQVVRSAFAEISPNSDG
ncbi:MULTISPECIES: hypothetical protein [Rhizobium/Agrobacterium group]|uniref:hypothetical protein n=1 Tax=Rhizobium/Agrobacterium group TaxID=227290 RepID=UPI0004D3D0E3|nr:MULTISPECIES: hypothetical protein [Rhizobium/Agrobacterium group]KEA04501.1 hypothetical protein CN09_19395 [Rhizobium rhizogenes]NMV72399.1 hypothetical protein [Agrobacterium fabrum]NTI85315.1 hypothetical protein [Rhizobium rhizogenes]NTJ27498.1 hypothetical protein [Rhizobium rhizogenes]QRM41888.1 hypothetical protein F3X89_29140 [Rhizobium rhizogenes]